VAAPGRCRTVEERELARRSVAAEIGVALRWHDRTAQRRLCEAATLVEDFPATVEALGAATITARHADVFDRLTHQARALRRVVDARDPDPDVTDQRSIDQTRADLLCDLVLGGRPVVDPTHAHLPGGLGAIRAEVSVVIPVPTAAGASERAAMLDGCSPIDAATAKELMGRPPSATSRASASVITS